MNRVEKFYKDGSYFKNNPDWDRADTEWKFTQLITHIDESLKGETPKTVCEIGCGSGDFLRKLGLKYPKHEFHGWDISPDAKRFWIDVPANVYLHVGDILSSSEKQKYDLILSMDVIEHVSDPIDFIYRISQFSNQFIFHIPLDLSAISVFFDHKLLLVRKTVGHIHYFTKDIACELLKESGLQIKSTHFTNAWQSSPQRSRNHVISWAKRFLYFTLGARAANLIGGQTLIAICSSQATL